MSDVLEQRSRDAADGLRRRSDVSDREVDEALAIVRQRSVFVADRDQLRSGRRRIVLAAAAAVVAVGTAGLLLVDRGGDRVVTPVTSPDDVDQPLGPSTVAPTQTEDGTQPSVTQITTVPPTSVDGRVSVPVIERLAVGDGVMLSAADELVGRGFVVDAVADRQFDDGLRVLEEVVAEGRPVGTLVLHLGTNGTIDERMNERLENVISEVADRTFVVTSAVPREWAAPNNDRLQDVAATRDDVELVPWDAIAPRCLGRCLYDDEVHLDTDGAQLYAGVLDATTSPLDGAATELEDLRHARVTALSGFDGYSASSIRRSVHSDGSVVDASSRFTMVNSGSVWVDTGDDTWGSHDAATDTTRSAFRDPDGQLRYQEVGAQGDASLPLGILVGHDPTSFSEDVVGDGVSVVERTIDGRAGWDVTWVDAIEQTPSDPGEVHTYVVRRRIDANTGLIVAEERLSTAPGSTAESSSIDDIVLDVRLPDEFPGLIPEGASVDRSGPPPTLRPEASPVDVVAAFGGPAPAPEWVDDAEITIRWSPFVWQESADLDRLIVSYVRRQGFVETRAEVTTTRLASDGTTVPTGQSIVDGWLCQDPIDDAACQPAGDDGVRVRGGAFDGEVAVARSGLGAVSGTVGIFDLRILGPDLDAPEAEFSRFVWLAG